MDDKTWERRWVNDLKYGVGVAGEKAWEDFFACYHRLSEKYIRSKMRWNSDPKFEADVVQHVWEQAWHERQTFKAEEVDRFYFWLRRIGQYYVYDKWREIERKPGEISLDDDEVSPLEELFTIDVPQDSPEYRFILKEISQCFDMVIDELPDKPRRWLLMWISGMKSGEIAEIEHEKESTVRKALERARKQIKGRCSEGDEE